MTKYIIITTSTLKRANELKELLEAHNIKVRMVKNIIFKKHYDLSFKFQGYISMYNALLRSYTDSEIKIILNDENFKTLDEIKIAKKGIVEIWM